METFILLTPYTCEVHKRKFIIAKEVAQEVKWFVPHSAANLKNTLMAFSGIDIIRLHNHCADRLGLKALRSFTYATEHREELVNTVIQHIEDVYKLRAPITSKSSGGRSSGSVAKVQAICQSMKGKSRAEIIAACLEEGINKGTAAVQYAAWRKANA